MATNLIGTYDYNPVHAIWYFLNTHMDLPETMLDSTSFAQAAAVVKAEGTGVSLYARDHQPAVTYVRSLLAHINGVITYGTDGKFHLKLIRKDYNKANLFEVNTSCLIGEPTFERGSWSDTTGEVKVQYFMRIVHGTTTTTST